MAADGRAHRSRLLALLGIAILALVPNLTSPDASAQSGTPTVQVDRTVVTVGETVTVTGVGWEPGRLVQVETCGNLGLNGSIDCAVASGISVVVAPGGSWRTPLTVATPPKPCPCVVSAREVQGNGTATTELTIVGAVEAAPTPEEEPYESIGDRLVVTEMSIAGNGPLLSWFGAAPERELVLTVLNTGARPIRQLPIDLVVGRHPDPDDRQTVAVIDALEPGELRTVRLPLTIGSPAIGTYRVDGLVAGSVPFETRTRVTPWGLLVVVTAGIGAVALYLVSHRERFRRPR